MGVFACLSLNLLRMSAFRPAGRKSGLRYVVVLEMVGDLFLNHKHIIGVQNPICGNKNQISPADCVSGADFTANYRIYPKQACNRPKMREYMARIFYCLCNRAEDFPIEPVRKKGSTALSLVGRNLHVSLTRLLSSVRESRVIIITT